MLEYELVENGDETVVYRYFPEGSSDFGTVTILKHGKNIADYVLAKDDELKWYFYKIVKLIKKFIDSGKYEKSGMIAWY